MAIELNSRKPLSETDNDTFAENEAVARLFKDMQCNVLAPHRCLYSYHLFIGFSANREEARAYVHGRTVNEFRVTSFGSRRAFEQQRQRSYLPYYAALRQPVGLVAKLLRLVSAEKTPLLPGPALRPVMRSFMISASGLVALKRPDEKYPALTDTPFFAQAAPTENSLYTPSPSAAGSLAWDSPFDQKELHAHLLLAGDNLVELKEAVNQELDALDRYHGKKLGERFGYRKRIGPPGQEQDIEHFGYVDGISNPLFLASDLEHKAFLNTDPAVVQNEHFYARSNLLFELPQHPGTYGSFQVFRQIEQDVAAFSEIPNPDQVVGRRKDGTPLVRTRGPDLNDFNYEDEPPAKDKTAPRCPFHAHIRKANPRTIRDEKLRAEHRAVQFVRRGMLYGQKKLCLQSGTVLDEAGPVGLLFMGYMGSIEHQFVRMQRSWFPNENFPGSDSSLGVKNVDALVSLPAPQTPPLTTVKGCGFFFVPPISWMETLPYSWP